MKPILKNLWVVFVCGSLSAEVIGIVGGGTDAATGSGNVFLINSLGTTTPVVDPSLGNPITIGSVAMNRSAQSIMAGRFFLNPPNYATLISSTGQLTPYSNNGTVIASNNAAAINQSGYSATAGNNGQPVLFVADPAGNVGGPGIFSASCSSSADLTSIAINDSNWIVAGGNVGQNFKDGLYVVQLAPGSSTVQEVICDLTANSQTRIQSVDLNNSGQAVVGGLLQLNSYAALFNVADPSSLVNVTFPFATGGQIFGVAINGSGTSILGGQDNNLAAYAVLVQPTGQLEAPLSGTPLPSSGSINSVDVTDGFGFAFIGGQDATNGGAMYAAFVDVNGNVHNVQGLPTGANATISSVSMNEWGIALIGGTIDGTNAYAALVNPYNGSTTVLDVTGPPVESVSIRNFVPSFHFTRSHLNLTGNNLVFAKYILQFAPKKAIYFSPSLFNGTLTDALESAAPTRNALSVFAMDNNLFYLNNGLSSHLRHRRQLRSRSSLIEGQPIAFVQEEDAMQWEEDRFFAEAVEELSWEEELLASDDDEEEEWLYSTASLHQERNSSDLIEEDTMSYEERPYTLWTEALGAWASQKEQHQTVGFNPTSAGFILAFEKTWSQKHQLGFGFSYLFTHIHEKKDAGFSNINQECLFLYGSGSFGRFYLDAALWGGVFQTDQERKIHMTGFDFKSTSHPGGGQLDPHVEIGYALVNKRGKDHTWQFMLDPFVMADWVNTWQGSYKERGSGPFNAGQKSHYSSFLRIESGLCFYEAVRFDAWILGFEQKGSYVYKKPFSIGKVNAFLVGSPGSFTVETLTSQENLGLAEVAVLFNPIDNLYPYGSIAYQGEFSSAYKSQQLTLEISWDF